MSDFVSTNIAGREMKVEFGKIGMLSNAAGTVPSSYALQWKSPHGCASARIASIGIFRRQVNSAFVACFFTLWDNNGRINRLFVNHIYKEDMYGEQMFSYHKVDYLRRVDLPFDSTKSGSGQYMEPAQWFT